MKLKALTNKEITDNPFVEHSRGGKLDAVVFRKAGFKTGKGLHSHANSYELEMVSGALGIVKPYGEDSGKSVMMNLVKSIMLERMGWLCE